MSSSQQTRRDPPAPEQQDAAAPTPSLCPEDFYHDGPYIVFTAAYHLKRGYCCNSGCRHCPYAQ